MDKINIEGTLYRSSLYKDGANDVDWKMREAQVKKACEYSPNPELLLEFLRSVPLQITRKGIVAGYFERSDVPRMILEVTVGEGRNAYTFEYGMSQLDTTTIENKGRTIEEVNRDRWPSSDVKAARLQEIRSGELYGVLCSIGSEYYCPALFEDFCAEFGYDEDSRKAYALWERHLEASARLHKVVPERFIEAMPS